MKIKAHVLAKQLGITTKEVMQKTGAKSAMSIIDEKVAEQMLAAVNSADSFLEKMEAQAEANVEAAKEESQSEGKSEPQTATKPEKAEQPKPKSTDEIVAEAVAKALAKQQAAFDARKSVEAAVAKSDTPVDMKDCPISLEELELSIRCRGGKSPYWKWNMLLKK